jgi:hypothetical protein
MPEPSEPVVLFYATARQRPPHAVESVLATAVVIGCTYVCMWALLVEVQLFAQHASLSARGAFPLADAVLYDLNRPVLAAHFAAAGGLWFVAMRLRHADLFQPLVHLLLALAAISLLLLGCVPLLFRRTFIALPAVAPYLFQVFAFQAAAYAVVLLIALLLRVGTRPTLAHAFLFVPALMLIPVCMFPGDLWSPTPRPVQCVAALVAGWAVCGLLRLTSRRFAIPASPASASLIVGTVGIALMQFWLCKITSGFYFCVTWPSPPHPEINLVHLPVLFADAAAIYCISHARGSNPRSEKG